MKKGLCFMHRSPTRLDKYELWLIFTQPERFETVECEVCGVTDVALKES